MHGSSGRQECDGKIWNLSKHPSAEQLMNKGRAAAGEGLGWVRLSLAVIDGGSMRLLYPQALSLERCLNLPMSSSIQSMSPASIVFSLSPNTSSGKALTNASSPGWKFLTSLLNA